MITVRWGGAKRWSSDLAGLLLDWRLEDGSLALVLDYAALRAAHKDVSVTTATWGLDGAQYRTTMATVVPAEGVMHIVALSLLREEGLGAR